MEVVDISHKITSNKFIKFATKAISITTKVMNIKAMNITINHIKTTKMVKLKRNQVNSSKTNPYHKSTHTRTSNFLLN